MKKGRYGIASYDYRNNNTVFVSSGDDLFYSAFGRKPKKSGENISKDNLWFKEIINKKSKSYNIIHQRYLKNKKSLKKELANIINLINNLPKEKILLPMYSSLITQNPHYLDIDNSHSVLFFSILSDIDNINYANNREEKIKLLQKHNIEIDNISNFAITYKLLSNKESINSFEKGNETLILNIQNIMNIESIDTKKKRVFIFENPSILSEIINKNIDESIIIADGFPNTSVHLLIEKLIKTNNRLYYNGDFDPEGLLIASKLKEKYKDNIELFCYTKEDYECCVSKNIINDSRLKKLNKVNYKDLNYLVVYYSLMKCMNGREYISIDDLLKIDDSPVKLLNIDKILLNEYLDEMKRNDLIIINRTAGLNMVYLREKLSLQDIVKLYFE